MIYLVYLVCSQMQPVALDCHQVKIKKPSLEACKKSAERYIGRTPAWCDTGKGYESFTDWYEREKQELIIKRGGII